MKSTVTKFIFLSILIFSLFILAGCGNRGIPVPHAKKDTIYYFPKTSVKVNTDFRFNEKNKETTKKYFTAQSVEILKNSGYFMGISEQNKKYTLTIDYDQYYPHVFNNALNAVFSAFNPFSTPEFEVVYILKIKIYNGKKVIENYRYEERYKDTENKIISIGKSFFKESMEKFLKELSVKSKMEKIEVKE